MFGKRKDINDCPVTRYYVRNVELRGPVSMEKVNGEWL